MMTNEEIEDVVLEALEDAPERGWTVAGIRRAVEDLGYTLTARDTNNAVRRLLNLGEVSNRGMHGPKRAYGVTRNVFIQSS